MPQVQNPAGVGMLSALTRLTPSQIVNLNATPITIVPAPGAGRIIVPVAIGLALNFNSVAYLTTGADTLTVAYGNVGGATAFATAAGLVTSVGNAFSSMLRVALTTQSFNPGIDNAGIVLKAAALYNAGPIQTATINAAGTGYAVNDTGTINGGSADATYQITSIGAAGAVTGFTVTSPGTKYVTATGATTTDGGAQPGVGTGFKVNITAIQTGDGTLEVLTGYMILPFP